MNPGALLTQLSNRGFWVTLADGNIKIRGPVSGITSDEVVALQAAKPDIVRLLTLVDGQPVNGEASRLLAMNEVDPDEVPSCESCERFCDVQTLDDQWRCSPCDPDAGERRRRTERLIRLAESIRYTHGRNG
ncbi:hypothetical protein OAG76_01695 [Rubripirellula sp.]|nr:hypothetical protein [Rubripirellula sp.]MDB4634096.1 hypothetical protein [Rubripirellula sp.]